MLVRVVTVIKASEPASAHEHEQDLALPRPVRLLLLPSLPVLWCGRSGSGVGVCVGLSGVSCGDGHVTVGVVLSKPNRPNTSEAPSTPNVKP